MGSNFFISGLIFSIIILNSRYVRAQLPDTDIYVLSYSFENDTLKFAEIPRTITVRPGYDNQPWFTHHGKYVLFSSIGEDQQADIMVHKIRNGQEWNLIETP